jgi:uncharacterized protein YqeY
MGIWESVTEDLTRSMKAKDSTRVEGLRLIRAEGLKKEKEKGDPQLTDEVMIQLLKSMAKQRRESIELFEKANRNDPVAKEKGQLEVIESYLPASLDDSVVDRLIDEAIAATGAAGPKDMGKVMGLLMRKLKEAGGLVDGAAVNAKVKARLGG